MKFTAQEEYGLRCILQLARKQLEAGDAKPGLTVAEIAGLEGLTPQYAGKLISILVKSELLESVRGRGGGVRLTRPCAEISVAEVLRELGGDLYQEATCDRFTGDRSFCVHTNDCAIRSLWSGLQMMINTVLSKTTLKDLCASESTMDQWMKSHEDAYESFRPIASVHTFTEE